MRKFIINMAVLAVLVVGIPGSIIAISFGAGWLDSLDQAPSRMISVPVKGY